MSEKHLRKGSKFPQKENGQLRLYSTKYCPYAQRVRIVLALKDIPYETVNLHCFDKPEWMYDLNPAGLVPIFDTGTELLTESLKICNYLEKAFPKPSLPLNERDATLLAEFDALLALFYKVANNPDLGDFLQLLKHVEKYEGELSKRGKYFGGDEPRMIDFMIWPWAERAAMFDKLFPEHLPAPDALHNLRAWCARMRQHPTLLQLRTNVESQIEIYDLVRAGKHKEIDFDI
ncbi:hypothetical protein PPYR_13566 [Photinus pyralis]|uniref:Uncharacterized protein n=1 Tax=Photinus pyralis TaxID=7054 RepID=A0A5N4A9E1_PHOPY|nr:pyrimidodiazepine synthase-like [Photinus pyralis]KAB0793946.1 hypothetical protein PPYR_13566 [Photinus pyralis]